MNVKGRKSISCYLAKSLPSNCSILDSLPNAVRNGMVDSDETVRASLSSTVVTVASSWGKGVGVASKATVGIWISPIIL